jgi:glutamate 5-kinase
MIIVKIGTESLENFETSEKVNRMVRDISALIQKYKERILLVSS